MQPPDKPRRVNLITPTRYTPKSAINKHGNVKGAYAALRADTKKYFYGFPRGKPKSDKFLGLYERPGVRRLSGSAAASAGTTHTPKKKKGRLKMIFHTGYSSRPIGRLFPATEIAKAYARRRLPLSSPFKYARRCVPRADRGYPTKYLLSHEAAGDYPTKVFFAFTIPRRCRTAIPRSLFTIPRSYQNGVYYPTK